MAYVTAMRRVWLTEWRHTYRSARREHSFRVSLLKWMRYLSKGIADLPAHAREIRSH